MDRVKISRRKLFSLCLTNMFSGVVMMVLMAPITQACLRGVNIYQRQDTLVGKVYEYYDSDDPHPGRGLERVDGTNNNQSVPTFLVALEPEANMNVRTNSLQICSLTQPDVVRTFHFILVDGTCGSYAATRSDQATVTTVLDMKVPLDFDPDSDVSMALGRVSTCQGPQGLVYSTVSLGEPFCNPGHAALFQRDIYTYGMAVYCPAVTPDESYSVQYEHTENSNHVTASIECNPGFDIAQGQTGSLTCNDDSDGQWSGTPPECERVYCGSLPTVARGEYVVMEDSAVTLSVARLECDRGFIALAEDTLFCRRSGWTLPNGYCQRVTCGPPPPIDHGVYANYLGQPSEYESTVILRCAEGFVASDPSPILTCLATGYWSQLGHHCRSPQCSDPGVPFDGGRHGDDFSDGSIINFYCNDGFILAGNPNAVCHTGQWSAERPQCSPVSCPQLPFPDHGLWTWDARHYGTILFQCRPGFQMIGHNATTCYSGRWQWPSPVCRAPACDPPGEPEHGRRFGDDFGHLSVVHFVCDGGFVLEGSATAVCNAGHWSSDTPLCQAVDCPELPPIVHGAWMWDAYDLARVRFLCLPGYELHGQASAVCYEGQWRSTLPSCRACPIGQYKEVLNGEGCQRCPARSSTTLPASGSAEDCICQPGTMLSEDGRSCRDIGCPPFPPLDNGRRGWEVFEFGLAISFECAPGYELVGHHYSICQSDDHWSSEAPWCRPCPMGQFKEGMDNASCLPCAHNMVTYHEGSASCECTHGYQPDTNGPGCIETVCTQIYPPDHGLVTINGYTPGSSAQYSCAAGHRLTGTPRRLCLNSGEWSHIAPECQEWSCPRLVNPMNGVMMTTNNDYVIGTAVVFRCDSSYELFGEEVLDCVEMDGEAVWNGQPPRCRTDQ